VTGKQVIFICILSTVLLGLSALAGACAYELVGYLREGRSLELSWIFIILALLGLILSGAGFIQIALPRSDRLDVARRWLTIILGIGAVLTAIGMLGIAAPAFMEKVLSGEETKRGMRPSGGIRPFEVALPDEVAQVMQVLESGDPARMSEIRELLGKEALQVSLPSGGIRCWWPADGPRPVAFIVDFEGTPAKARKHTAWYRREDPPIVTTQQEVFASLQRGEKVSMSAVREMMGGEQEVRLAAEGPAVLSLWRVRGIALTVRADEHGEFAVSVDLPKVGSEAGWTRGEREAGEEKPK